MKRASALVLLSRFQTLEQIALAAPLWTCETTKQYIHKFTNIIKQPPDLVAEKKRQDHYALLTKRQYPLLLQRSAAISSKQ